jgi:hypothetical protein
MRNKQLKTAVKKASVYGISVAMSNPCFELWFLMHYEFTTRPMQNYDDVKKRLLQYMPGYEKSTDVFDSLNGKLCDAINNCKRLKQYHSNSGVRNLIDVSVAPYTNIWEIIEEIQSTNIRART